MIPVFTSIWRLFRGSTLYHCTAMANIRDIKETPNLRTADIVFTSGSTVTIDAPVEQVFAALLNFEGYHEWSSWCPKLTFPEALDVGVGSQGILHCRMDAQGREYDIPVTVCTHAFKREAPIS